jgi:outer membrane protein assembly factor BamB
MRLLIFCLALAAYAGPDWPRFRGPNGSGIQPDQQLPAEIGKNRNVVWTQKTPKGNSSPIVVGGRIWITGHEGDDRLLLCFDAATGAPVWRRAVKKAFVEPPNPMNGPTTPTPATDGHAIFVFFPDLGLIAWDFDGKERWRVPMGPFGGVQGMAASPVYAEGNVILQIDTPEQAYVQAFDSATGKSVWKKERPLGFLGSYATPSVYRPKSGPVQIVVAGAVELTGYQASTGERLWWVRGVTTAPANLPLIAGDSVYTMEPVGDAAPPFKQMLSQYDKNKNGQIELSEISGDSLNDKIMYRIFKAVDKVTGNDDGVVTEQEWNKAFAIVGGGLVRTRLGGKGDLSGSSVMWRYTKGLPYVTAPLLYDNILYVVRNGGVVATIDPETGKLIKESRLKDAIGDYYAQPVAGDGKIYFVSKDGKATIIRPGAEWEQLSTADLDEQVIATPAIADNRIYIRTEGTLYCFGVVKPG